MSDVCGNQEAHASPPYRAEQGLGTHRHVVADKALQCRAQGKVKKLVNTFIDRMDDERNCEESNHCWHHLVNCGNENAQGNVQGSCSRGQL